MRHTCVYRNCRIKLIESAQEEASTEDASASDEVDEDQSRAAEEERRQQEQKQREIELARLAELEEIAAQEREAELARQAAELSGRIIKIPEDFDFTKWKMLIFNTFKNIQSLQDNRKLKHANNKRKKMKQLEVVTQRSKN